MTFKDALVMKALEKAAEARANVAKEAELWLEAAALAEVLVDAIAEPCDLCLYAYNAMVAARLASETVRKADTARLAVEAPWAEATEKLIRAEDMAAEAKLRAKAAATEPARLAAETDNGIAAKVMAEAEAVKKEAEAANAKAGTVRAEAEMAKRAAWKEFITLAKKAAETAGQ